MRDTFVAIEAIRVRSAGSACRTASGASEYSRRNAQMREDEIARVAELRGRHFPGGGQRFGHRRSFFPGGTRADCRNLQRVDAPGARASDGDLHERAQVAIGRAGLVGRLREHLREGGVGRRALRRIPVDDPGTRRRPGRWRCRRMPRPPPVRRESPSSTQKTTHGCRVVVRRVERELVDRALRVRRASRARSTRRSRTASRSAFSIVGLERRRARRARHPSRSGHCRSRGTCARRRSRVRRGRARRDPRCGS